MTIFVFLIALFTALLIGTPIAFSLILGAVCSMFYMGNFDASVISQNVIKGAQNFSLLAVPFFILAGEIMSVGGIGRRLVDFGIALVGHIKGGLGYVAIMAALLFAGLSGSAIADAAALGAILMPMMVKGGYDKGKSMGIIASGSIIAVLIPPSIALITYGVIANVSITRLFMAGYVPGFLMATSLAITWYFVNRRNMDIEMLPKQSKGEIWKAFKNAIWALIMPLIILIGLRGGIFTPTEAASVAVFYSLFISLFIYKEMKMSDLSKILISTAKMTSSIMFMVVAAFACAWVISVANIPAQLKELLGPLINYPTLLLVAVIVLVLILGLILDISPILLIVVPIVLPLLTSVGYDAAYVGILIVLAGAIGLITPPVGAVLSVGVSVGKMTMMQLVKGIWPYIVAYIILLLLFIIFPGIIMIPTEWFMR